MASSFYIISAEATSRKGQPRHEAQNLRLERRLPDGSPWYKMDLSVRWLPQDGSGCTAEGLGLSS